MKNLLGFVQNYQQGGYVNPFDPTPTQQDVFNEYDIELTDDKYLPFLPTYDAMGQQFDVTNYIQNRQGLEAGGRSALSNLGQRSRETSAQQGFAGMGKSLLDTTRSDIVDQFGRDATRLYTGLQQDVYQRQRGFGEDMLSAVFDLGEDAYTMGEDGGGGGDSLEDLPYQGQNQITFRGQNAFWDATLGRYIYGTLTEDEDGGTVENIYGDPSDPQTPTGGVDINWTESQASGFDFFTNTGQYIYLSDVNQYLVWDNNQNRYVEYTGG